MSEVLVMGEVPKRVTPLSPKVAAGAVGGALASLIVAVAALLGVAVEGEFAAALGVVGGTLVSVLAGWATRDGLRDAGQAALDDGLVG